MKTQYIYQITLVNIEPWEWDAYPYYFVYRNKTIKAFYYKNCIYTKFYNGDICFDVLKEQLKQKFIFKCEEEEVFLPHQHKPWRIE